MSTPESLFPALQNCLYLNHAAVAPWPQVTADAVQTFAAENARQGTLNYPHWLTVEQALREQARQLLNAPTAGDIALVKNTSEGLSFVAYGLNWCEGDNVVGVRQEFPSNRYVWQSLASQGVEFRQLDLNLHPDAPEDALLALCDERTRLISISAVQYTNGLRMDLGKVGEFCRANGILFCVDAIQQLGAIPLDVQQVQADFVVADGHKWMLGPEGLALFYVRREVLEQLRLTQYGWHMAEGLTDYSMEEYQPALDARRFECGSPNMLGIHALHASLGVLLNTGMDTVWEQLSARVQYLLDGLQALPDMEILSDMRTERRSGIVTFRSRTVANEVLFKQLQDNGVFCALRGGGIRFSPHFYTPFAQLARVLTVLTS
jgi:cysteine desulfurase / selenocysteine lyase